MRESYSRVIPWMTACLPAVRVMRNPVIIPGMKKHLNISLWRCNPHKAEGKKLLLFYRVIISCTLKLLCAVTTATRKSFQSNAGGEKCWVELKLDHITQSYTSVRREQAGEWQKPIKSSIQPPTYSSIHQIRQSIHFPIHPSYSYCTWMDVLTYIQFFKAINSHLMHYKKLCSNLSPGVSAVLTFGHRIWCTRAGKTRLKDQGGEPVTQGAGS